MDPLQIHAQAEDLLFESDPPSNRAQTEQAANAIPAPPPQTYTGLNHTIVAQILLPGQEPVTPYVYAEFYARIDGPQIKYYFLGVKNAATPFGKWWVDPEFMDRLISEGVTEIQNDFPFRHFKGTNMQIHFRDPQIGYHSKVDALPFRYDHPAQALTQHTAPDILTHSNGRHPYAKVTVYLTPQPMERKMTTKEEDDKLMTNITKTILYAKRRWINGFPQNHQPHNWTQHQQQQQQRATTLDRREEDTTQVQPQPMPSTSAAASIQPQGEQQLQQQQQHQFHPYLQTDRRAKVKSKNWKQRVYF